MTKNTDSSHKERFKIWMFTFVFTLFSAQPASILLYRLIIIIESYQLLWYVFYPNYGFPHSSNATDWFETLMKKTQINTILDQNDETVVAVLLSCVFGFQFLSYGLSLFSVVKIRRSQQSVSRNITMLLNVSSLSVLFIHTVLALPMFYIYLSMIICSNKNLIYGQLQCYQGVHIFYCIISSIGLLVQILTSLIFHLFFINSNPFSPRPIAAPRSRLDLYKFSLRFLLPLYNVIDFERKYGDIFLYVYGGVWVIICIFRYLRPPFFNRSISRFQRSIEAFILCVVTEEIMHMAVNPNHKSISILVFFCISCPLIVFANTTLMKKRIHSYRGKKITDLKKDLEAEMYINTILNLIIHRKKKTKLMNLEGVFRYHTKHCVSSKCGCFNVGQNTEVYDKFQDRSWYRWINDIINECIEKFPKSIRLRILSAYLNKEKLSSKFKAVFSITLGPGAKTTIEEEFDMFKLRMVIERQMIEEDQREAEERGMDLNKIIYFHKQFAVFDALVENTAKHYLMFWKELQMENLDAKKIRITGSLMVGSIEKVFKLYNKLSKINPNNLELVQLYYQVQRYVIGDRQEAIKAQEKVNHLNAAVTASQKLLHHNDVQIAENPDVCLITVSGDIRTMGTILEISNHITRILDFSKSELLGQNIDVIMPQVIREGHDQFMQNYFDLSYSKVMGAERLVFPIDKGRYIKPCNVLVHLIPTLNKGIRLVGFLEEAESNRREIKSETTLIPRVYYIMYDADTNIIKGVSLTCFEDFGISSALVDNETGDEFTIDKIFPDFEDILDEELKSVDGVKTFLDTSNLRQEYYIPDQVSVSLHSQADSDSERISKFRRARVNIMMIKDARYYHTQVRVLRFVEIADEEPNDDAPPVVKLKTKRRDLTMKKHDGNETEETSSCLIDEEMDGETLSSQDEEPEEIQNLRVLASQKKAPKYVKIMGVMRVFWLLVILFFQCFGYYLSRLQENEFREYYTQLRQFYKRHSTIAELNFRVRELELLAKYQSPHFTQEERDTREYELRSKISNILGSLSNIEYEITQSIENGENPNFSSTNNKEFVFEILYNAELRNETHLYSNGLYHYIAAVTQIRNASLVGFTISAHALDSTLNNFLFVKRNGLGPLLEGSELIIESHYDDFLQRVDKFNVYHLIMLVCCSMLLVVFRLLWTLILYKMNKSNIQVLSLVGYIPIHIIDEMSDRCSDFIYGYFASNESERSRRRSQQNRQTHIDHIEHHRSNKFKSQRPSVSSRHHSENISEGGDVSERIRNSQVPSIHLENKEAKDNIATYRSNLSSYRAPLIRAQAENTLHTFVEQHDRGMPESSSTRKSKMREEDMKHEEEQEVADEIGYERAQKLNKLDNTNHWIIPIRILVATLPWVVLLTLDYLVFEKMFLDKTQLAMEHLNVLSARQAYLNYFNTFTLEEVAEAGNADLIYTHPGESNKVNQWVRYKALLQQNSKDINNGKWSSLPGSFDDYLEKLNLLNDGNICSHYYRLLGQEEECSNIVNGLLTKGLTLSITSSILGYDDVLREYKKVLKGIDTSNSSQLNPAIIGALQSSKYQDSEMIIDNITPVLQQLEDEYCQAFSSYMDYVNKISTIILLIFIAFAILMSFAIWGRIVNKMVCDIVATRTILGLMPWNLIINSRDSKLLTLLDEGLRKLR